MAFGPSTAQPISQEQESAVVLQLATALQRRLNAYKVRSALDDKRKLEIASLHCCLVKHGGLEINFSDYQPTLEVRP